MAAALSTADPQPRQLLLVLIIGATLMGIAASMRELVKERPIYLRERAIGLSIGAYLSSKVVVLTLLTTVQAIAFTLIALAGRNGPDAPLIFGSATFEIVVAVVGAALASMLTGLLISAVISNADRGMPLLVVLVMVQLILCGGLFAVNGRAGLEQASWLVPSRWSYAMVAATTDVGRAIRTPDPLWRHSVGVWFGDALALTTFAVIVTVAVAVSIRRLDPQRRRAR